MIPTIGGGLLYRVHHEKEYLRTCMERKRAFMLMGMILVCTGLIIWLLN